MTRGVPKCLYVRHRPGYELRRARGIKEAFATRFPPFNLSSEPHLPVNSSPL